MRRTAIAFSIFSNIPAHNTFFFLFFLPLANSSLSLSLFLPGILSFRSALQRHHHFLLLPAPFVQILVLYIYKFLTTSSLECNYFSIFFFFSALSLHRVLCVYTVRENCLFQHWSLKSSPGHASSCRASPRLTQPRFVWFKKAKVCHNFARGLSLSSPQLQLLCSALFFSFYLSRHLLFATFHCRIYFSAKVGWTLFYLIKKLTWLFMQKKRKKERREKQIWKVRNSQKYMRHFSFISRLCNKSFNCEKTSLERDKCRITKLSLAGTKKWHIFRFKSTMDAIVNF